jgi:hypothetical protein
MLIAHHPRLTDESVVVDSAENCQENFADIFRFFCPRDDPL